MHAPVEVTRPTRYGYQLRPRSSAVVAVVARPRRSTWSAILAILFERIGGGRW